MIDMHYDILSIIYSCYLNDDYSYIEEWAKNYNEKNVNGLIANLYFLSEEEMKKELGDKYDKVDVVEMFKITTNIFKRFLPDVKVVFSIEGCDYIENVEELEELYNLGLRNILLVWNNPNKYGSGNRSCNGLTDEGRKFLVRAIDLGICIDLSHMNYKTFYDTIDLLKKQKKLGKKIKVIASHSNSYELCGDKRNLTNGQLLALKEFDSVVGIVSYPPFVCLEKIDKNNIRDKYLEHIEYIVNLLGIDHVGIATDDMSFPSVIFKTSKDDKIFEYGTIKKELVELLSKKFNNKEIDKILYKNIERKLF